MGTNTLRPCHAASIAAALAVTLTACGGSLRPEDIPDISGSWAYSESVSSENAAVSCEMLGMLSLEQSFETFVGSFTRTVNCAGIGRKPTSSLESGPISQGKVDEKTIEFRIGTCDYRGTFTEDPPERISGSALCLTASLATASAPSADAGSWEAKRLTGPTP